MNFEEHTLNHYANFIVSSLMYVPYSRGSATSK